MVRKWEFWPTLMTFIGLLVLIGLGSWQVARHFEKEAMIAERESQLAAEPVPAEDLLAHPALANFRRVIAAGIWRHDQELYVAARSFRGNPGYWIMTPFQLQGGRGTLLVNRGWVPLDRKDPETRKEGQATGEVTITGIAQEGQTQKWLVPDNQPANNFWIWIDLAGMYKVLGITDGPPFYVNSDAVELPGGYPVGGQTRIELPRDHLSYAATWYMLAVTLLIVFTLYHRRKSGQP